MYYVYILKGKKYYCWYTNNLHRRLQEHKRGGTLTTRILEAYELIWYFKKDTQQEAKNLERKIKDSWDIERWTKDEKFIKEISV